MKTITAIALIAACAAPRPPVLEQPPASPTPYCVNAQVEDDKGEVHAVQICVDDEKFCTSGRQRALVLLAGALSYLVTVPMVGECWSSAPPAPT